MAKGYPSRKRARKAYWRGVKVARTGRGRNPYLHPILKDLFERGRTKAPARGAPLGGGSRTGGALGAQSTSPAMPSRGGASQSSSPGGASAWSQRFGDHPRT